MRSTFKILFYLKKRNENRQGRTPLMCRITINGEVAQFSTKLSVDARLWDTEMGCVVGRTEHARHINTNIDNIRYNIADHYFAILNKEQHISASKVKNAYLGLTSHKETLLALFMSHNEDFKNLIGRGKSQSTYNKYCNVYRHLQRFILTKYNKNDIGFMELDDRFIQDFNLYLRVEAGCSTNTVWVYMMPLKRMITIARHRGYISLNPFYNYHISLEDKDRGYLSRYDLETMLKAQLSSRRLVIVRDLFIFSCFTGLAYTDISNLTQNNLKHSFDGNLWIVTRRQKTNMPINIRLLDVPRMIVEQYARKHANGKMFQVPSNCRCNLALKEIAAELDIKTHLTFHLARHTFATTVTLSNGVPIETVSKMLGHTNIKTTQIYARITNVKLSHDMELLSNELKGLSDMLNTTKSGHIKGTGNYKKEKILSELEQL